MEEDKEDTECNVGDEGVADEVERNASGSSMLLVQDCADEKFIYLCKYH